MKMADDMKMYMHQRKKTETQMKKNMKKSWKPKTEWTNDRQNMKVYWWEHRTGPKSGKTQIS